MAIDQDRKRRTAPFTPEEQERIEAVRQAAQAPRRATNSRTREILDQEYRETGTIETTGDGTTMGDMVAFRRFITSLRQEHERLGLSLNDMAERSKIEKAALSRLENGQQLNPTVNTLARYVHASAKVLSGHSATELNRPTRLPRPGGTDDGHEPHLRHAERPARFLTSTARIEMSSFGLPDPRHRTTSLKSRSILPRSDNVRPSPTASMSRVVAKLLAGRRPSPRGRRRSRGTAGLPVARRTDRSS